MCGEDEGVYRDRQAWWGTGRSTREAGAQVSCGSRKELSLAGDDQIPVEEVEERYGKVTRFWSVI